MLGRHRASCRSFLPCTAGWFSCNARQHLPWAATVSALAFGTFFRPLERLDNLDFPAASISGRNVPISFLFCSLPGFEPLFRFCVLICCSLQSSDFLSCQMQLHNNSDGQFSCFMPCILANFGKKTNLPFAPTFPDL